MGRPSGTKAAIVALSTAAAFFVTLGQPTTSAWASDDHRPGKDGKKAEDGDGCAGRTVKDGKDDWDEEQAQEAKDWWEAVSGGLSGNDKAWKNAWSHLEEDGPAEKDVREVGDDGPGKDDWKDSRDGWAGQDGWEGKDVKDEDGWAGKDGRERKDGEPGKDERFGKDGEPGRDGRDGLAGKDGCGRDDELGRDDWADKDDGDWRWDWDWDWDDKKPVGDRRDRV